MRIKIIIVMLFGILIQSQALAEGAPIQEAPRPEPKIIMSEYKISKDEIMAGDEFTIDVTLLNTERSWHTKNIVVTYTSEGMDILANGKTNTIFISEIKDEETHMVTLVLKARKDSEPKPQKINIDISYEDSDRMSYDATAQIIVEIRQPIRMEYDEPSIPKTVNAGDSLPVSMQIFNMGKSTLYNVLVTIEMTGAIPDGSAYLGNMLSGTSATAEIYTFFGTLDMGDNKTETDEKYGRSEGLATITYEDEYGKSYSESMELVTSIERPVFDDIYDKQEKPVEVPEKKSQWWVSIFLLLGIIMILVGAISYKRKVNKLKREYGDENI